MYLRHTLAGRAVRLMVILALCAGWTAAGEAAPVTFTFAATVTQAGGVPDDPFSGAVSIGTPINGHFTFESTTPDLIPGTTRGSFTSPYAAPYGLGVSIGAFSFSTTGGNLNLNTGNNDGGKDHFGLVACPEEVCMSVFFSLVFLDTDGTAFDGDALPVAAPPLHLFETAMFRLWGPFNGNWADVIGTVTSLTCSAGCDPAATPVPEPGTLGMVGLAISTLIGRGARSRRRQA